MIQANLAWPHAALQLAAGAFLAFALADMADLLVYAPLRGRGLWLIAGLHVVPMRVVFMAALAPTF